MPVVTMVAGPNGSGKSTLTDLLVKRGVDFGEYLNADDIARNLIGDPIETAALAQKAVRDARSAALTEGRDHCFETVMSHISHIEHVMDAKRAGFRTRMFFVATDDAGVNLARVGNRVAHGGHHVPADRIMARYFRCLGNLPAAIAASDEGVIFDNSSAEAPFRHLATIIRGEVHPDLSELGTGRFSRSSLQTMPTWWLDYLLLNRASSGKRP